MLLRMSNFEKQFLGNKLFVPTLETNHNGRGTLLQTIVSGYGNPIETLQRVLSGFGDRGEVFSIVVNSASHLSFIGVRRSRLTLHVTQRKPSLGIGTDVSRLHSPSDISKHSMEFIALSPLKSRPPIT